MEKKRRKRGTRKPRPTGASFEQAPGQKESTRASAISSTPGSGVDTLTQVQSLGFVEFTAGLVHGAFDAIINTTVKQMDAYSELVADLAKTLAEFKAEHVTEAQVTAHLSARYPDGEGGTSVRPAFEFTDTPADPATGINAKPAHEKLLEVAGALISETRHNNVPLQFEGEHAIVDGATKFTEGQAGLARAAVREMLAIGMIEHLRAMAREGMSRIVITEGELMSKLTFNVTATSQQEVQKSRYRKDEAKAGVKGRYGGGRWNTQFNMGHSSLNVNTMNETSFDQVTMNAEIIGMVKIKFKTESFPPIATNDPIQ